METVKIVHKRLGFVEINKCDFDKRKHQLFLESKPKTEKKKAVNRNASNKSRS